MRSPVPEKFKSKNVIRKLLSLSTILIGGSLGAVLAHAYPDFIGYGYTTCITCHYSNQGGGALTDYGRALYSQEIAARAFIPKRLNDEDLAKLSGFLPGLEIPRVRPNANYRGLWLDSQPRSVGERVRYIHMQRDLGVTFLLDDKQRSIITLSYGLLPASMDYYGYGTRTEWVSRQHYLRFYASDKILVQAGLFDKAFGIRHPDHTAVNRGAIGLGMNDQTHGVSIQYLSKKWEATAHAFAGNLLETTERRQAGGAITGEYEVAEKNRAGASFLHSTGDAYDRTLVSIHDRWGLPQARGSAILAEAGLAQLKEHGKGEVILGNYIWIEALVNLTRGYNLLTTFERRQDESKYTAPEIQRWTFGFLTFPFQRLEFRFSSVQTKTFSPEGATDDKWAIQGQVHVSI